MIFRKIGFERFDSKNKRMLILNLFMLFSIRVVPMPKNCYAPHDNYYNTNYNKLKKQKMQIFSFFVFYLPIIVYANVKLRQIVP